MVREVSKSFTSRKKVLLTGASRGIGEAIRTELEQTDLYDIIAPLRPELDLGCRDSIDSYIAPEVDILINNAGINIVKPIEELSDANIDDVFQVNLIAPLKLAKKVIPSMKKKKFGRIVNISSIWGVRSKEMRTLYSSTKFGLIGQTKSLCRELGEYGILINAVCPGFVGTELTYSILSKDEISELEKQVPLGRFANPSEIAKLVKYLISDENTYITGQALVIDGGYTA